MIKKSILCIFIIFGVAAVAHSQSIIPISSFSNSQENTSSSSFQNSDVVISGSNLINGQEYLIFYSVAYGGGGTSDLPEVTVSYGSTDIANGADEGSSSGTPEAMRVASLHGYYILTGDGTSDLRIRWRIQSGADAYITGKSLIAIPLNSLTLNTDYWYAVQNGDASEISTTSSFTNLITSTVSLPETGDYLVLMSAEGWTQNGSANDGEAFRTVINSSTQKDVMVKEWENDNARRSFSYARIHSLNAGNNTFDLEVGSGKGSNSKSFRRGRIIIIKSSSFEQMVSTSNNNDFTNTSNYSSFGNYLSQSYTPNQSEHVVIIGNAWCEQGQNFRSVIMRLENSTDNSFFSDYISDDAKLLGFDTPMLSTFGTEQISSQKNYVLQVSGESSYSTANHFQYGDLIVWSMTQVSSMQPPVVTDIPNQTISEGFTFATISLDNYVSDLDNIDSEISWTYSGNTELTITINASRVATITIPNLDWNGAEIITFRATDPDLQFSEDVATFTVTAQNDAPVVTNIPNQTIDEGLTFTTITLDNFVSDIDNNDAEMVWTYSGNTELTVSIDASRVATVTIPNLNWNGTETITFRATDPGTLWSEDIATFTVTALNDNPTILAGASTVTTSPVNRVGNNTTIFSADFTDIDQPLVSSFSVTLKIREPNNTTELILVNNLTDGNGGLTVVDNGGGFYTASFTYDPSVGQTLGLYDLYFEVNDGAVSAIDGFANNIDELEIIQVNTPTLVAGATQVSVSPVNRFLTNSTIISTTFNDLDQPGASAFTCSFKIRQPDNATELFLVNGLTNGNGGLSIVDNGGGSYTASYTYNPDDVQVLGLYDLYFEVTDGTGSGVDTYASNSDELEINEVLPPASPIIIAGASAVSFSPVNRLGNSATTITVDFTDSNMPPVSSFIVLLKVREPNNATELILVNNLSNGSGGLSILDYGDGSYSVGFTFNPNDAQTLGFYDIYCAIDDNTGTATAVDDYTNNLDEFEIIESLNNEAPTVQSDATIAVPAGVERIGNNPTTISAQFSDLDIPGITAFQVSFKLRYSVDQSEIILADNLTNGTGGVTISDLGAGLYEASISWNPPDAQPLGFYDLYFHVTDGIDISIDRFADNREELQLFDAISNNPPALVADTTFALPISVNRIGTEFTMLKTAFWDADYPGNGAFTITIKVQDPLLLETIIVNSAKHGEQGLRVVHRGDSLYEASVLWDPSVVAVTGLYDLYFEVTDNNGASVIDGYAINAGELTVTSSAPLGDGFLLHRTNDAEGCGGPTSACHNLKGHKAQDCRTCHEPHSTTNIYLVKDSIQTPNSGLREVIFKTLGIGDPYNDPDPVVGDATSGVLADDADGVNTGVCEVCHTAVNHHTNDDSHAGQAHHNAEDCTSCHSHADGFAGGESGGGDGCSCHSEILSSMQDGTASSYHHFIQTDNADYNVTSKTCLMCHVHHDIFRPDLNPGFGQRASNLRADITTPVVQGDATVLANSDYLVTGTGGICLSCHTSTQTKSYVQPDGTTQTPLLSKTDYDNATSAHNYSIPITFASDGSIFNSNCTKCHNDNMTKQYQNSTRTVSTHDSDIRRMLDSLGNATPSDPLEEQFCFSCHSTTSNPNAGANLDFFGVKGMGVDAINIEAIFNQTFSHPVSATSGVHSPLEDAGTMARHVECEDCHNPHAAATGIGGTGLPNSLIGVSGIDELGNPIASVTASHQICFKCHGDNPGNNTQITRQFNNDLNTRLEFSSASASYHPVTAVGKNNNSPSLINGWTETSIMTCSDCHASSVGTVNGPHASENNYLLKLRYDSGDNLAESASRYALCYSCHDRNSILNDESFGDHDKHIRGENAPCSVCHDAHASTGQEHLINFDINVCTPGGGRLEFTDDSPTQFRGTCYVTCHGKDHTPKTY